MGYNEEEPIYGRNNHEQDYHICQELRSTQQEDPDCWSFTHRSDPPSEQGNQVDEQFLDGKRFVRRVLPLGRDLTKRRVP